MFYELFLSSYLFFSMICFIIDYYYPYYRLIPYEKTKIIKEYKKMMPIVFLNIVISHPFFYLSKNYYKIINKNNNYFFYNFFLWLILSDIIFYTTHRILHTKKLYFIHALHHSYRYTFGLGAIYAHPIEFVLNNLCSLIVPILLLGIPSNHVTIIILLISFMTVVLSHGGYIKDQSHLIHHLKYTYNYSFFITDYIFGTKL